MGYSDDPRMVRVDFFKPSGKWMETEAVKWTGDYYGLKLTENGERISGQLIHEAFAKSLRDHLNYEDGRMRMQDMDAICLEPYHEHEHPIQIKNGGWNEYIRSIDGDQEWRLERIYKER